MIDEIGIVGQATPEMKDHFDAPFRGPGQGGIYGRDPGIVGGNFLPLVIGGRKLPLVFYAARRRV
ncbi:hypothetical protein [Streptomyces lydicus]|uniref:hypothetical protein n=1 Tax=Streptomyces lydicus TaxID=47763 RepID=UPI0036F1109F